MKRDTIICIFFLLTSCTVKNGTRKVVDNTGGEQRIEISENYIKLCYGIDTQIDSSNLMEKAMYLLNRSEYRACLGVLGKIRGKIDTVYWHSGFYALIIADSNIHSYKGAKINYSDPVNYLSFRYNNFLEDIVNDEQSILLQCSVKREKSEDLYRLQYLEGDALYDNLRTPDSIGSRRVIEAALELKLQHPDSKRLDFILAYCYLKINNETKAVPLIDKLINENYYALPCLNLILKYYERRLMHTKEVKYRNIFLQKFPAHCLLPDTSNLTSDDFIFQAYNNCIKNGTQRESLKANLYLAKYGLSRRNFKLVDSVTNTYYKSVSDVSYDSLRVFERDEYSQIVMKSMFLRGNYSKLKELFHETNAKNGYNLYFRGMIKDYFIEFISSDTSSFEKYYMRNFDN